MADEEKRTPLHWAAGMGHADVATLLLKEGAALEAADSKGNTPLMYAGAFCWALWGLWGRSGRVGCGAFGASAGVCTVTCALSSNTRPHIHHSWLRAPRPGASAPAGRRQRCG